MRCRAGHRHRQHPRRGRRAAPAQIPQVPIPQQRPVHQPTQRRVDQPRPGQFREHRQAVQNSLLHRRQMPTPFHPVRQQIPAIHPQLRHRAAPARHGHLDDWRLIGQLLQPRRSLVTGRRHGTPQQRRAHTGQQLHRRLGVNPRQHPHQLASPQPGDPVARGNRITTISESSQVTNPSNSLCFERQLAIGPDQARRATSLVGRDGQLAIKA
jgi:hypothetical protein